MSRVAAFEDGPASGQSLSIARHPLLLRVTRNEKLELDALDQLEDEPQPGETLIAYRRVNTSHGFVDYRGKDRHKSGPMTISRYRIVDPQPDQEVMRDRARWQAWCLEQQPKAKA